MTIHDSILLTLKQTQDLPTSTQIAKRIGKKVSSTSSELYKMCGRGEIFRQMGSSMRYKTKSAWNYSIN